MKKICAMILAAAIAISLCACNIKDVTKIASAGDEYIGKGEFNYYLQQGKALAMQAASGEGETLTQDSPSEQWNSIMIDGKTAMQYAIDEAKENAKQVLLLKAKAVADGITLSEEDKENIKKQRQNIIDQYGGRYNYEQYFTEGGFTLEDVEKILTDSAYAQKVYEKYFGDDGEESDKVTVTDEQAKEYYENEFVYVKHILISSKDEEAEEVPEETEEVAEGEENSEETAAETEEDADAKAKAEAEELIKKIEDGANFDKLMKEYSDDKNSETGEINGADGYVFTKKQMVPEFEEAAFALEVGGLTKEPVKTSYGYHIIKRLALPMSGELYEEGIEKAKDAAASENMDSVMDKWAEELGFKFNDKAISKIKLK